MWISDFSIKSPVVTIVAMVALLVFGLFSYVFLKTDEFPEVNPPIVALAVPYPGAGPSQVERELVVPIEDALAGISGVNKIRSTSMDSFAILIVEFVFEKDPRDCTQEIRDKLSEIRSDLPPEMEEPVLTRFDPQDMPIVSLTLSSETYEQADLSRLADPGITGDLQGVSGVASAKAVGAVVPELGVNLRPGDLEAQGVSVGQVVQALQLANLAAPVGAVTSARTESTIRLAGRLEKARDFERISLVSTGGRLLRLADVADVAAGTAERRSLALFNGKPAVGIEIVKANGASTTDVAERVLARVEAIRRTLPEGVTLEVVRNSGHRVEDSVWDVQKTLFEGAALTVLVVLLFLGSWRSTLITTLALPVSVISSFTAVFALGYTLNTMSLLGLSLAIGILVDDAIVVRENIVRHLHMGKDHLRAAHEGTAEIGLAVAATTFSIVVVFVPIAFMGGLAEQWMGPMALTIAASVLVSLFVSFSLDPMMSAYWEDPDAHHDPAQRGLLARLLFPFEAWLERQTGRYERVVSWALRHRLLMVFVALLAFGAALALPATGLVGSSFFPVSDQSEFDLVLEFPPGSSMAYGERKLAEVVETIAENENVAYTFATIGAASSAIDEGQVYVKLLPKHERAIHQEEVASQVATAVDRIAGVSAAVTGGFGPQKQIDLQLTGPDMAVLQQIALDLSERVRGVPGAVDLGLSSRGQKQEIEVRIDRDLAGSLGLTVGQVAQALRPAFAGIDVGDWVDSQGETRDVTVRFAEDARRKVEDLASVPLVVLGERGPTTLPLGQVAEIHTSRGPALIDHVNRRRVVSVEANARGVPLSDVNDGIAEIVDAMTFPPGYGVAAAGDSADQAEVFGRMLGAMVVGIVMMYLILVVQFGSFVEPMAIMASLPLSLIGVMLALFATGSTVNLMSMIGVILLMGIVAKNAILLIDFAKIAEAEGLDRRTALVKAGGTRLRPILMTSVAIVAGMLPVAIGAGEGADFRAPLGRAVIGGVVTSTFLTLLVIPTIYDMMTGARDWAMALVLPRRAAHGEPAPHPAK